MEPADVPDSSKLDRLRDLLAGLGGALVNGDLLGWAGAGDLAAVPDEVFGVVRDAGLLGDGDPLHPVSMPADADALMSRLWEIDEPAATELLTSLAGSASRNVPRRGRLRRRYADDPADIFAELAGLIGPGSQWWTNTDLTRWNPITQHTFDAVIVGAGNGIIVTVIAFEGGG
ncbi:MAG TPA: hypothetical protein VMA73_24535 [Streptosporangiaceae bacterium]|nr:hypothetical protein [Streptosporangiaceae bacterium]